MADADLIPVPGQLELHGRCRSGVLLSPCFGALYLSQIQFWGWRNYNYNTGAEADLISEKNE